MDTIKPQGWWYSGAICSIYCNEVFVILVISAFFITILKTQLCEMAFLKGNILLQKTNYSGQRHEHILTVLLTPKLSFVPRIFTTIVTVLTLNVKRSIRIETVIYKPTSCYLCVFYLIFFYLMGVMYQILFFCN